MKTVLSYNKWMHRGQGISKIRRSPVSFFIQTVKSLICIETPAWIFSMFIFLFIFWGPIVICYFVFGKGTSENVTTSARGISGTCCYIFWCNNKCLIYLWPKFNKQLKVIIVWHCDNYSPFISCSKKWKHPEVMWNGLQRRGAGSTRIPYCL